MAKLIHILAISVGSGFLLGAGIRLAESLGPSSGKPSRRIKDPSTAGPVRTAHGPGPEWQTALSDVAVRIDRQQTEVDSIRRQMGNVSRTADVVGGTTDGLRDDLHRQFTQELDQRLAALEEKLHLSLQAANRENANAMVASIETRVANRISLLEIEIGGQSAALAELRECSSQSERSILRLLTVLERTVNPAARPAEPVPARGSLSGLAESADPSGTDLPKLSVEAYPERDQPGDGSTAMRRPAGVR